MAADGSISIVAELDDKKAQTELNRLQKRIDDIAAKVRQAQADRLPWADQASRLVTQLDAAKARLYEMEHAAYGTFTSDQIEQQKETVKSLQAQWEAAQRQVDKYDRSIATSTGKLEAATVRAGDLSAQLVGAGDAGASAGSRMAGGFTAASAAAAKLERRIMGLVRRVFVFSMITMGLRAVRSWFGQIIKANDEASAAIARLKAALLTMVQPLKEVLIPAITNLLNLLTQLVMYVASFFAAMQGKSLQEVADAARAEQEALERVGKAAKKAGKQLAGFDEINRLSGETAETTAEATAKSYDFEGLSDFISSADGSRLDGLIDRLKILAGVAAVAYAAFGRLGGGLTLTAGGVALVSEGFLDMFENGMDMNNALETAAGLFAGGLGISILTGSIIPGLIGALLGIPVVLVQLFGDSELFVDGLKKMFGGLGKFFKSVQEGDMKSAFEGLNEAWEGAKQSGKAVVEASQNAWEEFWEWFDKNASDNEREIGFIVKDGIEGLLHILTLFWDEAAKFWDPDKTLQNVVDFVENVKQTFSDFRDSLEAIFRAIGRMWNDIVVGDGEAAADELGNIFFGIINLLIDLANFFIRDLNKISWDVPDWVPWIGGNHYGVKIPEIPKIPYLAQGAVIPPNREFLAVLGDQKQGQNIEAPLDTIVAAFRQAMREGGSGRTVVLQLNDREFARFVLDAYNQENQRVGISLGGAR